MKLSKIELKDFRGFPGPETFTFDLAGGKNLLLHGENGSGKSSLYRALLEILNLDPNARPFHSHRNVFSSGPDATAVDGFVALETDDGTRFEWKFLGKRPHADEKQPEPIREAATDSSRRAALLTYRSLLRTNYGTEKITERLFALAVTTLLANVPVTLPGGTEQTISQLWQNLLRSKPARHSKRTRRQVSFAERAFNDGFRAILPDVEKRVVDFLSFFAGTGLEVHLELPGVRYNGDPPLTKLRGFVDQVLEFEVKLNGVKIPEWNDFLNEARLSALALSLYLAGAVMGNPNPPASVRSPLKLLVLDDVLIGLDLTNRMPVLELIETRLPDYQVLLLTHDKVWFDMSQLALTRPEQWVVYEMHSKQVRQSTYLFDSPVVKPQTDKLAEHFLALAEEHLNTRHDNRTAALHGRTAFEIKLKSYCSNRKVHVPYDLDGRHLNTDHFLHAVERRLWSSGKMPRALFSIQRVKLFRDGVLNPLAHFHPVTLSKKEVEKALQAVAALEFSTDKVDFARKAHEILSRPAPTPDELLEAACWLRTGFEVDTRSLLKRLNGKVRFREDWNDLNLGEIWVAARRAMQASNPIAAPSLIADIQNHKNLFLSAWKHSTAASLDKPSLDAAWAALKDPASIRTRLATFI